MKRLVLEVLTTKWGKLIRVIGQTHRGVAFAHKTNNLSVFLATGGFNLMSQTSPEYGIDCLFVRGSNSDKDKDVIVVPSEEWLSRCEEAVKEYNKKFFRETKTDSDGDIQTIE